MNTVGYIDVVGETKLIMLELAELQKENEQLRAELTTARADAIRECVSEVADVFRSVKATYIPVNRAMEITATALELLSEESLTTKEGDDGPTESQQQADADFVGEQREWHLPRLNRAAKQFIMLFPIESAQALSKIKTPYDD